MNEDNTFGCFVVILVGLFIGMGVALGNTYRDKKWKDACVEQGVAEWSVDKTGRTSWNWKSK